MRLRHVTAALSRAVVALTLVVFAIQCFVTQTHIHLPRAIAAGTAAVLPGAHLAGSKLGAPGFEVKRGGGGPFDDPDKCPLCQEFLYAGNYVSPAAVALYAPSVAVSAIAAKTPFVAPTRVVSYSWHGRAPPTV